MPVPTHTAWSTMAVRSVIALCAFALLATTVLGEAQPTAGAELGSQISSGRRSQNYYESQMKAQDRQLASIKRQAKASRQAFKRAKRSVKRSRRALTQAKRVVVQRRARAKELNRRFDDPSDAPKPWRYEKRLRQVRSELRYAERRKAGIARRLRASQRSANARKYRLRALKRSRRTAVYRREVAEGALGGLIGRMTRLAAARVGKQTAVRLTSGGSFSWPSTGRVVQTYGCTGFRLNPRRGSCRHFHDGLDIVDSYGTRIRAAAVGVVAYVGWNPYDEGGRAWIVVVAHPDGFVTRYGHLAPSRRVRAGSLVHTGQVIGRMGNTGRSTGTHLHFELLRGGNTVNPLSYLPSGVVKIRVDKKSTKKGRAAARKKMKSKKRAAEKRQAIKARKRAKRVAAARAKESVSISCEPVQVDPAAGTGMLYAVALVADAERDSTADVACTEEAPPELGPPASTSTASDSQGDGRTTAPARDRGVPLPFRGTSPTPS